MKAIKIGLYVFAGLVVLLVLAVAVFAMTFNPNRYKGQIESLVKEKTGRSLRLAGNLEVAVWPSLGANVNGVTLSERGSDQTFVALDSAHASVAVLPLLHGAVVVDGIRVSGLKANVVKNKDGTFNFSDLLQGGGAGGQKKPEKKAEERKAQGGQAVAFDIAGVHIDRSAVTYRDLASGQELALSDFSLDTGRIAQQADGKLALKAAVKGKNPDVDVNLDVGGHYKFDLPAEDFSLSGLDAKVSGAAAGLKNLALTAKGDVSANPEKSEYHAKGFTLEAKGAMPDQSFEAKVSAPQVDIAADKAKGGAITAQATLKQAARQIEAALQLSGVEGSAKALSIPKFTANIAMSGAGVPQKSVKVPVTGSLRADLEKQTLNADLSSKFDESTIQAKLGLAKFSPPSYLFDVNVDRLNVDRYFPPEKPAAQPSGGKPPATGKPEEDTPVDLSALKDLNANGRLQVGSLQVKGLKLANVKAEIRAAKGRLDVAPHSANLYGGAVAGTMSAQADGRVAVKENLTGISIGPLLRDAANKDILDGKGNVALDVAAAGKSVDAMKKSLDGTARLLLRNGAIKGVNIAEILRKAKTVLSSQQAKTQATQAQQTDFSEMSASFVIKNGVARNNDLDVKAPLFRVGGQGEVNIPASTLDYTVKASVVATTKGQGGAELGELSGVTIPVHLTGPLADMKYDVDYSAVARNVAKSKIGEKLKEKLGAPSGQGGSDLGKKLDKLKGLFGR